jgi:ppGpp synthetase/RelA/SpoT-type nucleotidyltranferase
MTDKTAIEYFSENWSTDDRFTNKLADMVDDMIEDIGLDVAQIDARTKSIESFRDKIERPDKNYRDPINEITDLCGVRIVCYFNKDVDELCGKIREFFDVDEKASINKAPRPTELGYRSKHLIISLGAAREALQEYKQFHGMRAEIQVRTIGQHAWAAIEHKFNYKRESKIPEDVERRLFRISAVLEMCDDEFSRVKAEIDKITIGLNTNINRGNLNLAITVESLKAYMDSSPKSYEDFTAALRTRGLQFRKRSLTPDRAFDLAVTRLRKLNFPTIESLDRALKEKFEDFIEPTMQIFSDGDQPMISQPYLVRIFASFYRDPKSIEKTIKKIRAASTVRKTKKRPRSP